MAWEKEHADVVRKMIVHESDVTNHRLQWLLTLEGLLFTALGVVWRDSRDLVGVLAAVGIATAISLFVALFGANKACRDLYAEWQKNKPKDYNGPPVIGHPPISWWQSLLLPWFLLPVLLVVAWMYVVFAD